MNYLPIIAVLIVVGGIALIWWSERSWRKEFRDRQDEIREWEEFEEYRL